MASNHESLVTLAAVATEMEAQLLVGLLDEQGIAAVATGGYTSQFKAEAPGGVRVLVKQGDLAAAKEALARREQEPRLSGTADEDEESSGYEPRLTRFGIGVLLILELITVLGIIVAWSMGANVMAGLLELVAAVLIVAAILGRWWSARH